MTGRVRPESTFTADSCFRPSAIPTITSLGAPWMVEVIGATVTVCRSATTSSRVSTNTGLRLSGLPKMFSHTSPRCTVRFTPRATPPPRPNPLVVVQPDRNGCYSGSRGITFTLGGDGSEILRDPPQGGRTGRIDPVGKDRTGGGLPPAECADPAVGRPGRTRTWTTRHGDRGAGGGHSTDGREGAQALCTGRLRGYVGTPQAESRAGNGAGWRRRGAVGRHRL